MKTVFLAIIVSFVMVSCAGHKDESIVSKCELIVKGSDLEEKSEPVKRHKRW